MFSVRLVTADSYQATPLPQLDPTYSEFRGAEIKHVPIVRVFGTASTGEKTCLHLHGVFPYMYVPFTGEDNANAYAYKLAASLDAAINISLGSAASNTQHVYQIQHIAGIPYYGYHRREHQFFKIYFYNPAMMKKAADLLQNGSVLNHRLQPHEAHIPFILQFMMDYNLHGMSLINLSKIKHRRDVTQIISETKSSGDSLLSPVDDINYLPVSVMRQSLCKLEVDALASDILNRGELEKGMELNPGLEAIWEEERARRMQAGLPYDDSQLLTPQSPKRPPYKATESDIYQQARLNHRLEIISQCDESTLSSSTTPPIPYPLEVNDDDQLINASNLGSNSVNNLDRSQQYLGDVTSLTSFNMSQGSKNSQSTHDSSILDAADMSLVEILNELARADDNQKAIDDDSVLGTQSSIFENIENKSDNEDEENVSDLNITCLELDSMSSWDNIEKSPSQLVPVNLLEINTEVPHRSLSDILRDTDTESQDSEGSRLPQLDGAGDLSNFLESEEDESRTQCEELKRVSECQTPILNNNLSNSDNEAFIIEELISGLSKSNKNGNFSTAFISDGTWPSYLPNETSLEQFNTMNYEPLGSIFESDFDNIMGMSLLLSNNDETSVDINLPVRDEEIPLAAVLNGDPCFTQTAEMDKSDFAELQDQYVSLLDSALVPDVYKNSFDSDIVNSCSDRTEEKEMESLNSRNFRFTTNSRDSNLSSENVTPNIQEPDAKVCKNKLNLPSALGRIDDNCKEFSRVPSDSSDYNCNVVATWEELQDPKFIPKRIIKRKRNGKSRKRILTRRPILNDSMSARRKGRTRKGVTNNITSHVVPTNVNNLDSSSSTQIDDVPLKIDNKILERSLCEKISMVEHSSYTATDDTEKISQNLSIEEPQTDNLLHVPISSEVNQVHRRISPTNLDSDLKQGEISDMLPSESVTDVHNTLPDAKYSTYNIGENDNVVTPIITDFEKLVDVSTESKISVDNNLQYLSHYSSARSHSGVFPFGKLNHRHCYACIRVGLVRDYVFTPDEIWVIEKRKRGKLPSLSSGICNKKCRLPFVPLQKLKIIDKSELNMTQLSINKMGPENFTLTCDSSKINTINDNYVDDTSIIHDFHQSESPKFIDIEDLSQISKSDEKLIEETSAICKTNVKNDDNILSDNTLLPINDFAFTQSAQISSTQNLDQFITNKKCEPSIIERVFDDKPCRTDVNSNNRSILLKLNNKNKTEVVNSKVRSPKIVEFSKRKNKKHDNAPVNMFEECIQLELMKNEREKKEEIIYPDATSIAIMQSIGTKKLSEVNNHDSILPSIFVETKNPELQSQIINMNGDETNIPKINLMLNKESNIISSSQSESAILNKRPEIRCSIDRNKVDLTFITAKNCEKDDVKNVVNTSDFRVNIPRISLECTESIDSQIFEDNIEVNMMSKNDISINSHEQQFNGFDDSTLDVHLCDSLYKDDVTSNNIFETTEPEEEHTTSTNSCDNDHESEQYTNAVAEANFYAGKNYTIDAISLEIPQCLFEEDSNSENTQRKSGDLLSENTLNAQTIEEFPSREIISDKSISDNCNNVSVNNFNLKQLCESNSEILSTTDNNSSSGNVTRHELSTSSDVRKSSTTQHSSATNELINENKSQNDSNYTCELPRPSTPEQLSCPENCHDNSKDYFDVEMIARMLDSILVLRENKTSYKSIVNKKNITQCSKKDLPNGSTENSNNLFRNSDENIVGSVIKYTPNKISIIRRIYLSKNKNAQKELNNLNVTTWNKNELFIKENKLRNNHMKISEVKKVIETKINNGKLFVYKNQEMPVLENCDIICENSVTKNNDEDVCMVKSQIHTHNNLSIAKSSSISDNAKPINELIHESNNNRLVPRFESLMIQNNKLPTSNIVDHSNMKVGIKIVEEPECIFNHENNNPNSSEISDNISKNVLVEAGHDNDHDDISQVVEHSKTNQYQKTDTIINAVTCSVNSTAHVAMNIDGNKIEDSSMNGNKSEKLDNVNSLEVSIGLEYNNEITAENCESNIECDSHDKDRVKSNILSQTTAHVIDNDINHSISIVKCRELSVVLKKLDINVLNEYLKNNQNVEVCDKSELKLTFDKKTNSEKISMKKKKCVRFNEQVFIFESDERVPLIDMEDQLHQSIVKENENKMHSSSDMDNLTEILEITEEHETVQSMTQSSEEFKNDKEYSIVSENSTVKCNGIFNDHDTEQKGNKIIKKVNEHVNEEIIHVDVDYSKLTVDCVKTNEASIKDSINEYKSLEIDMLSEKNKIINSEKKEVTQDKPQVMINVIDADEKYNSVIAINQNENVEIKKFTGDSKDIKMRCAVVLELCDKSVNGHVINCESNKLSFVKNSSQKKSIPQLIDKTNGHCDTASHDKFSTVIKHETKAISDSNEISVISPVNKPNNSHTKSRCKRKRNNIPTTPNQSITNISVNDISFVDDITNSYKCFQNSDRILRSYRTSSGYRNKIHTVSIDHKMVFTKVTISDQQLSKKSPKERYLSSIGLCSMKPRGLGWLPERTMTGSIQLQQPQVMLQRLTPSILKYYGYTRRFKSNRFGKRFKSSSDKINIPAYDGPADLSSSDSESDADVTLMSSEKRVCAYRSSKKNTEHEAIVTPKKRKQLCSDDDAEINEYKHPKCSTSKLNITPSRTLYRSPSRRRLLRSPGGSGNYSPLKITVTSPKVGKITENVSNESSHDNANVTVNLNAMCATPKRRKRLMYEKLLRNRIMPSSTSKHEDKVCGSKMNATQQLMGELNILNSSVTVPDTQSSSALSYHECQSENVFSNVKDTMNIRKNLFSSNANNPKIGVLSSQDNVEITSNDNNYIKNKTMSSDPEIAGPSTSGYINFDVKDSSEREDDEETIIFEEGSDEICLKYSPSVHSNEELDEANNEDDLCDVTFTQYLNSHEMSQQQNLFSNSNRTLSDSKKITIVPKFNSPTVKQIIDTMEMYNIPKFKNLEPFFSNQADAPGQKELAYKMLNVPGKGVTDLSAFKSSMENITGINRWRRMKINEFHPTPGAFKSTSIRQSLAGHSSVVITPLLSAPTRKSVIKWLRARDYLKKKEKKNNADETIVGGELKKFEKNIDHLKVTLQNECSYNSDSSVVEGSPDRIVVSNLSNFSSQTGINNKIDMSRVQTKLNVQEMPDNSSIISKSSSSIGEAESSLKSILAKSALFKSIEQPKPPGMSFGQIECLTNSIRTNVDNENMQKCKALTRYQFITIFCVEVHVITRDDLLPDPQHDSISALFYAIQSDVPPTSTIKPLEHGVIAVSTEAESKSSYYHGSNIPFVVDHVNDEKSLFETFINIVKRSDAEIFIGWEIESLSWGYIFQRALRLGINFIEGISRVPTSSCKRDNQMSNNLESLVDTKLPGRIVLDIWRIMKSELALLTYTFENVMYHVMNERLPCPSFKSLTNWWNLTQSRWKVIQHYNTKILGILRILEQLDIIGRTSEYARLFGIQFYEVFSRGSQFRVESIMLRLAKPLNFVAVSPSAQQRASMRAMEALPLIMEPESMFYSNPIVVLDFQSLYPSIIIAHNYCFSTCLGRVEHIGQPDPFEFGATVLRIPKHTALRLKGKTNYSPCGVAFVKQQVRRGILPRMLTEILNTRLMVKKAMKDHSHEDKLLQRVLHSRQKGLKDLANVTYGYTAANFTGRMPCMEVGDSVISKAKETLERAIKLVESTPKWGARVIYGDTDSLFILVPGKSKDDAFKVGYEIADAVTASNLSPIKLKFEKILYPAILQTKKRYCGYMYETPEQKEPTYLAKGIETVRRDGCPAVSKILEKSLRILFNTKDVSLVKQYVTRQLDKVLSGKVSLEDLTFAKEFRGLKGYKERACVPALELTRRLMKKDPRAIPRRSERVRYIIVAGAPNQALIHCVRSPWELINDPGLRPNGTYYVTRVIIPPLNRCLNLMGVDVNMWYKDMPRRQILDNPVAIPDNKQKQTIFQYFGTIICASCGRTSNKGICTDCLAHPTDTLIILHERLRWLERINSNVTMICQSCVGRGDVADCISLDCPVLYRRAQAQRDLTHHNGLRQIIESGGKFEF
ncbi:hypothetical protein PV327_001077 [Microctonus hyperodae]|uniref:DNA polymerase zeta catalytic subunit n=1 Tax=Microctonus hyperodae TaxID=165561 RepID=A0AA39G7U3_MICHY|nr:hypothetical protein PV327_001077 [Microctonus hyperodae]